MSNFNTMSTSELITEWAMAKDDVDLASLNLSTLKKHVKDIEVALKARGGPNITLPGFVPEDDEAGDEDYVQHADTEPDEVLDDDKSSLPTNCFYCNSELKYEDGYGVTLYNEEPACPDCLVALVEFNNSEGNQDTGAVDDEEN